MKPKKVFKNVLTEYFKYVLVREDMYNRNVHLPNSLWFNLDNLSDYFDSSEIKRIKEQYFTKIDANLKNGILKRYKNLKPYFKPKLWHQRDPENVSPSNDEEEMYHNFIQDINKPSTSGLQNVYTSPVNSPVRNTNQPTCSRCNSPVELLAESRHNSPIGSPAESCHNSPIGSPVESRNNSPIPGFSGTVRQSVQRSSGATVTRQPRRKRLKLYPFLNELPNNLPNLKPHESTLLLQSLDGRRLTDLNIPISICQRLKRKCLKYDPVTKRYAKYIDDNSENLPLHMVLKY